MRYYEFKIVESLLFELTDKVKNQMREKFKGENPNLEDEKINYYLDRWDKYANTFEPQYRDITRLRYDQVKTLIDDAATKAELKGGGERREVNPDEDLIYDKNNLVVHKGDLKEKCIVYGDGYRWCISRKDAQNMFYSYRMAVKETVFYFVFDKDKPKEDRWHRFVILVDKDGNFKVDDATNQGDRDMSWGEIERVQPKLRGLRALFRPQPLTPEERNDFDKYGKPVSFETYEKFSLTEKYKYIRFGHVLTKEQQIATPKELIPVYAKLMPVHITQDTWNRIKTGDKKYVEEQQIEALKNNGNLIKYMYKNGLIPPEYMQIIAIKNTKDSKDVRDIYSSIRLSFGLNSKEQPSEEVQLAAIERYPHIIDLIKNPSQEVQLAVVNDIGWLIKNIETPSKKTQWAAIKNDLESLKYITPDEKMQLYAVNEKPYFTLRVLKEKGIQPSDDIILSALERDGSSINFIDNPTEEQKNIAINTTPESIRYIKNPSEELQLLAVSQNGKVIAEIRMVLGKKPGPNVQKTSLANIKPGEYIPYFFVKENYTPSIIKWGKENGYISDTNQIIQSEKEK
jgi:lipoprotein-anchoring transpeptidase ErfK/SrfK